MMTRTCRTVLLGLILLWPTLSAAEERTAAESAAEHFERGAELYRDGSLEAALIEFERAYELVPDYRLLYNLGQVQTERKDYAEALALFELYLLEGGEKLDDARRIEVEHEVESLAKRVAEVWIDVNVAGAKITIDGVERGTSPLGDYLKVNAGVRSVRIFKVGFVPQNRTLKVAGRERPRLEVRLEPEPKPVGVPAPEQPSALDRADTLQYSQANYTPLWVSTTVALVLGGAAGTFGYIAMESDRSLDDELNQFPANRDRIATLSDRAEACSIAADGTLAGAAIAAALAVYYAIDPPRTPVERAPQTARVIPVGRGLGVGMTF